MIAERIKELRWERNLSQADLARKLGLTRSGINSWEAATSLPSIRYLVELAKFFHVTTDYMLGLSERTSLDISDLNQDDIALISDIASRLRRDGVK
jgi:transcriptional regulator with XRE-family HTH domain